jgi:glutamate-ammonia-ligase adenylyltransferase
MSVSDRLTEIAELITARTLDLAWRQMVAQFGAPAGRAGISVARCASRRRYGKLGASSSVMARPDPVFLHDWGEAQETDRVPPVDNQVFFLALRAAPGSIC